MPEGINLLNRTAAVDRPCRIASHTGIAAALMMAVLAAQPGFAKAPVSHARDRKVVAKPRPKAVPAEDVTEDPEPMRSEAASRMIAWVTAAHDNGTLPYVVIDKPTATLFLFNAKGNYQGQAPVLLGVGIGDDSTPGVGAKNLAEIGPAERTTPAGRFVAKFGKALGHQRVLWVDYMNSVALHAVITTHKSEHRVERLLSPTPDGNRISFGCINVGTSFYTKKLRPLLQRKGGVVYILPDTKSLDEVFPRVRLLPYLNSVASE